jgi:hypothetical protein
MVIKAKTRAMQFVYHSLKMHPIIKACDHLDVPLVAPSSGNRSTVPLTREEDWILHDAASTSDLAPRPSVSSFSSNGG